MVLHRKAANQGDTTAQFNLAVCSADGTGVMQDKKQAAVWYRKEADQGHATAQFNLGRRYTNGTGLTPDKKQAADWYRKRRIKNLQLVKRTSVCATLMAKG